VDLPIKNGGSFNSYVTVYQRVSWCIYQHSITCCLPRVGAHSHLWSYGLKSFLNQKRGVLQQPKCGRISNISKTLRSFYLVSNSEIGFLYGKITMFDGKSHYKWQFSIAFCMFTRGYTRGGHTLFTSSAKATVLAYGQTGSGKTYTMARGNAGHGARALQKWMIRTYYTYYSPLLSIIIIYYVYN